MPIRRAALFLLTMIAFGQTPPDPWKADQAITPDALATSLRSGKAPVILMVGPRILYNGGHVPGAIFAGPAGTEEGLALLRRQVAGLSRDAQIVLYCGCCPMEHCPNIRPAFRALAEAGFTRVRIVSIPTNLHTDWTGKGYQVEKGAVPK